MRSISRGAVALRMARVVAVLGARSLSLAWKPARTAAILLYSAMHGAADYLIGAAGARPSEDLATELITELRQLCRRCVRWEK